MLCPYILHEIEPGAESVAVAVAVAIRIHPGQEIPPQGEDIVHALGTRRVERVVNLVPGHADAREVHHGVDAEVGLHAAGEVEGHGRVGLAGPPRDVAEGRPVGRHGGDGGEEGLRRAVPGLRCEVLEGEDDVAVVGGERLLDSIDHLHFCFKNTKNKEPKIKSLFFNFFFILMVPAK